MVLWGDGRGKVVKCGPVGGREGEKVVKFGPVGGWEGEDGEIWSCAGTGGGKVVKFGPGGGGREGGR